MIQEGSGFLKPGTILLLLFMSAFGLGLYNWASANLDQTGEDSLNDQSNAIVCSTLEISNAGIQAENGTVRLFFESNKDLEQVNVNFEGERNVTKTVRLVQKNKIRGVNASLSGFSNVALKTLGCNRIFRFE